MHSKAKKITTGVLAFAVLLVAGHTILLLLATQKLQKAKRRLASADRPLSSKEVIPTPIAPADNAAPLYLEAIERLEDVTAALDDEKNPLTYELELIDEGALPMVIGFMEQEDIQQALARIREAAARPACQFEHDYTTGPAVEISEINGLRALQRLIVVEAMRQVYGDRPGSAYETILLGFDTSEALREQPLMISELVRHSQIQITFKALQLVCKKAPPNEAQITALRDRLPGLLRVEDKYRIFDGERILFGGWIFELPLRKDLDPETAARMDTEMALAGIYGRYLTRPVFRADYATYLNFMAEASERAEQPFAEQQKLNQVNLPNYCILTRLIVPALGSVLQQFTKLETQINLTDTALAMHAHRLRHGAAPASIEAVDAAILATPLNDPFDGKPLRFRDGVIYSVGLDGEDHHGNSEKDVIWHL